MIINKKELYLKRSVWVADYLASKKIARKRILVKDFSGETNDGTEIRANRNHNRRVEIKIIGR